MTGVRGAVCGVLVGQSVSCTLIGFSSFDSRWWYSWKRQTRCFTGLSSIVQFNSSCQAKKKSFLLSPNQYLTLRLALSISAINEACVVSRSAAWPLKLALFPVPWAVPIGQPHRLCFLPVITKQPFPNRKHYEFVLKVSGKNVQYTAHPSI